MRVLVVLLVLVGCSEGHPSLVEQSACAAAQQRFWAEEPDTLLTLADCGPYYQRPLPESEPGLFDLRDAPGD